MKFGRVRLVYYGVVLAALAGWFGWRALHPDLIVIRLHQPATVEIDGDPVPMADVAETLRKLGAGPRVSVVIDADDDVPAGVLVDVTGRVQAAGVRNIDYRTQPP